MLGEPRVTGGLFTEGDDRDAAILGGPVAELLDHGVDVERARRMVEGQDLDELPTERPVEEGIGPGALHPERLAGELDRLVVLDREVVVVHAVRRERELGRRQAAYRYRRASSAAR